MPSVPVKTKSPVVPGFRVAGVRCGIKTRGPDLALIASDVPASAAGVFTRSTVVGAPVTLSRERVRRGTARAIVANAGCSNVAMGARGLRDARTMTALAARAVGCKAEEVLVASTGVIGHPLPMDKIATGVAAAGAKLRADGLADAAHAILTTDLTPKCLSLRTRIDGRSVTLAGIAKGSGMIEPNMATMLSFLITDAAVAPALLRKLLRAAADASFNRVTVDGETSTSDTVLLLANGRCRPRAAARRGERGRKSLRGRARRAQPGARPRDRARRRGRDQARDGARQRREVRDRRGARREADRQLDAGEDGALRRRSELGPHPADGRRGARGDRAGARRGRRSAASRCSATARRPGDAARRRAGRALAKKEVEVALDLGAGRHAATVWTCDLSYEYVKINAEYTT